MKWFWLLLAGVLEVIWASGLKHADSWLDWAITTVLIAASFTMLIYSYKKIPVAVAYTVFVGIGTVGTYLVGILTGEPFSASQLIFLALLIAGVVGMKTFTNEPKEAGKGEQ